MHAECRGGERKTDSLPAAFAVRLLPQPSDPACRALAWPSLSLMRRKGRRISLKDLLKVNIKVNGQVNDKDNVNANANANGRSLPKSTSQSPQGWDSAPPSSNHRGRMTVNVLPRPGSLSTSMRPFSRPTSSRLRESPSPVPP